MDKHKLCSGGSTERSGRWAEHRNKERKVLPRFPALFLEVVFTEMRKGGGPGLGIDRCFILGRLILKCPEASK